MRSPLSGQYTNEDGAKAGGVPSSWRPVYSSADNATRAQGVRDSSANDSSAAAASAGVPSAPSSPEPAQSGALAVPPSLQVRALLVKVIKKCD